MLLDGEGSLIALCDDAEELGAARCARGVFEVDGEVPGTILLVGCWGREECAPGVVVAGYQRYRDKVER